MNTIKYLSVCSGIEAATAAWHGLGFEPVGFAEVEAFPSAVLRHHYPDVPNLGDMNNHEQWSLPSIDLLVGGTPCQSFSVAGLRGGLKDPRGGLMLRFLEIAQRRRPRWVVWENVPGVLSSNGGRDFGTFLGALGELGYGWAYRILDAQWFGVAQRRRRVFVVGCLGDSRRAAAVLFGRESVRRDSPPSREAREETAECLAHRADNGGSNSEGQRLIPSVVGSIDCRIGAQRAQNAQSGHIVPHTLSWCGEFAPTLIKEGTNVRRTGQNEDGWYVVTPHIGSGVRYLNYSHKYANDRITDSAGINPAITNRHRSCGNLNVAHLMGTDLQVRRLTPVECERLQGFPDNYTNIPWRKKPEAPDGPRYKALGNSMAVPVMRWIGQRIKENE